MSAKKYMYLKAKNCFKFLKHKCSCQVLVTGQFSACCLHQILATAQEHWAESLLRHSSCPCYYRFHIKQFFHSKSISSLTITDFFSHQTDGSGMELPHLLTWHLSHFALIFLEHVLTRAVHTTPMTWPPYMQIFCNYFTSNSFQPLFLTYFTECSCWVILLHHYQREGSNLWCRDRNVCLVRCGKRGTERGITDKTEGIPFF